MEQTSFLSDQCKAVILGSLLGDGSLKINKPYRNAGFSFRHSVSRKEYFFWKTQLLKEISGKFFFWKQEPNSLRGKMLRYQSATSQALTALYHLTHKRNRLVVRRRWLNMMTPLSLAIWWLDDGSIIANGRRGVICTDLFSYKEQKILAQYLEKIWKIKVHIGKITRRKNNKETHYYRLWFRSTEELKKFLRLILPYVKTASMLPKVLLLYRDSQLQQRWISEVSQLTGFPRKIVEQYLVEKKIKWKNFRE